MTMSELNPVSTLRAKLVESAKEGSKPEKVAGWVGKLSHAVANGMPWLFGYFKDSEGEPSRHQALVSQELDRLAPTYGFESADQLRSALIALRADLRDELSPEQWSNYFDGTLDIS